MTGIVDQPPRRGQQPRLGLLRHAVERPGFERSWLFFGSVRSAKPAAVS
jgi:hypothetical protein